MDQRALGGSFETHLAAGCDIEASERDDAVVGQARQYASFRHHKLSGRPESFIELYVKVCRTYERTVVPGPVSAIGERLPYRTLLIDNRISRTVGNHIHRLYDFVDRTAVPVDVEPERIFLRAPDGKRPGNYIPDGAEMVHGSRKEFRIAPGNGFAGSRRMRYLASHHKPVSFERMSVETGVVRSAERSFRADIVVGVGMGLASIRPLPCPGKSRRGIAVVLFHRHVPGLGSVKRIVGCRERNVRSERHTSKNQR